MQPLWFESSRSARLRDVKTTRLLVALLLALLLNVNAHVFTHLGDSVHVSHHHMRVFPPAVAVALTWLRRWLKATASMNSTVISQNGARKDTRAAPWVDERTESFAPTVFSQVGIILRVVSGGAATGSDQRLVPLLRGASDQNPRDIRVQPVLSHPPRCTPQKVKTICS